MYEYLLEIMKLFEDFYIIQKYLAACVTRLLNHLTIMYMNDGRVTAIVLKYNSFVQFL